jgi:hypothetical protein
MSCVEMWARLSWRQFIPRAVSGNLGVAVEQRPEATGRLGSEAQRYYAFANNHGRSVTNG